MGVVHGGKVRWLLHVRPYTGDSDLGTDVLLSAASERTVLAFPEWVALNEVKVWGTALNHRFQKDVWP